MPSTCMFLCSRLSRVGQGGIPVAQLQARCPSQPGRQPFPHSSPCLPLNSGNYSLGPGDTTPDLLQCLWATTLSPQRSPAHFILCKDSSQDMPRFTPGQRLAECEFIVGKRVVDTKGEVLGGSLFYLLQKTSAFGGRRATM